MPVPKVGWEGWKSPGAASEWQSPQVLLTLRGLGDECEVAPHTDGAACSAAHQALPGREELKFGPFLSSKELRTYYRWANFKYTVCSIFSS